MADKKSPSVMARIKAIIQARKRGDRKNTSIKERSKQNVLRRSRERGDTKNTSVSSERAPRARESGDIRNASVTDIADAMIRARSKGKERLFNK